MYLSQLIHPFHNTVIDNMISKLFETKESKDAFQELPLQPAYSLSDIGHQVFDQYSKLFTIKLQYIFVICK